jgi:hypothetical protein
MKLELKKLEKVECSTVLEGILISSRSVVDGATTEVQTTVLIITIIGNKEPERKYIPLILERKCEALYYSSRYWILDP